MEAWLTDTFPADGHGGVIVYSGEGVVISVVPATIAPLLGDTVAPTHAGLSALPIAKQNWQFIFDTWKAAGLIA